jgi:hypothetical protein
MLKAFMLGRLLSFMRVLFVVSLVILLVAPTQAHAQHIGWSRTVDASGTVLFGNRSERIVSSRLQIGRADSTLEVRSDARLRYADAPSDSGARIVTGRTWLASLALDYHPFDRVSPFTFGTVESSLQLSIARRASLGVGAKYTFVRHGDDEASASLAFLSERTRALDTETSSLVNTRRRLSLRVRGRRRFGKTYLSHVTFYQPSVADFNRFTVNTTTTLGVDLTGAIALTATLEDAYDSEARTRGARRNSDGQLVFGIRASF